MRNTSRVFRSGIQEGSWRTFGAVALVRAISLFLLACFLSQASVTAQIKETRRVLILNDLGIISSPGFAEIDQAVFAGLQKSQYQIELYHENLELTLFPDELSQHRFREEFIRRYTDRRPDVIIAAGSASLGFIGKLPEGILHDIPVIFCAVLGDPPVQHRPDMLVTGVVGRLRPEETLNAVLHLVPHTRHVIVVGGVGKFDEKFEAIARQAFRKYESQLEFTYLTDLTMPALLEQLRHLPSHTIVYHTAITRDAAGERFIDSAQSLPLVVSAANAPVFVMDDVDLREGAVGGDLVNWADDGGIAAEMAVRVLNGEKVKEIPVVESNNSYIFDWRALRRWHLGESNLPVGSILINRPPNFWQTYKWYILTGFFLLAAQMVAILGLLWQRARRRKIEAALRSSEEKFSKSFRQSPLSITLASTKDGRYIEVNETFVDQIGWKRDEVIGRSPIDLGIWMDPKQRSDVMKQLVSDGSVRDLEVKVRRRDGQVRTILGSAGLVHVNDEPCALSVFADITERKQAEEALASLSGRLIEAQEDERKRIARELHDDYNQRLAMIAIDLEELAENTSTEEARERLHELFNRVSEVGEDLHSLSHSLHSSTLEALGLVAGVGALCREFAEQHEIEVEFTHQDVPPGIHGETALCLFRIVQEALRNIKRHSGASRAEVRLEGLSGRIQLSVSDEGIGFDPDLHAAERGIGLRSMEERLRLLEGHLEIHSRPTQGTRIEASLPLEAAVSQLAS